MCECSRSFWFELDKHLKVVLTSAVLTLLIAPDLPCPIFPIGLQFIEETVFTCPFTGVQRDILLERNMFPYDVPTDVEHWTLWSRTDLTESEMEAFVTKWTAENHPHVVEWECDNNEGDRSIDWYHVHVFFRLDCPDNSGARRDPFSVYTGPCGSAAITPSVPANDQNVEEQQQKKDAGATG